MRGISFGLAQARADEAGFMKCFSGIVFDEEGQADWIRGMMRCISCQIGNHRMCLLGKVDCFCGCVEREAAKHDRKFSPEQLRIIEESELEAE